MPAAAIPLATSGIGAIFQGIGAGKSRTATSTYDNKSEQSANLTGKQRRLDKNLFQQILEQLKLGPQVSQSDRNTARTQINNTYDASLDNIDANLASRGYSGGGKTGAATRDLAIERAKGFQSSEATLRDQALQRFQQMIQNAFQYNTPRSFTNSSTGTQTGTQPGTPWQSSVGGGIGDLSSYLWMRNLQGGAGGGANPNAWAYGMCWISEELYGPDDFRVGLLRCWLSQRSRESIAWFGFVALYKLTGRNIVKLLRRSERATRHARKCFDLLVLRAMVA